MLFFKKIILQWLGSLGYLINFFSRSSRKHIRFHENKKHVFFGYYDISPFDKENQYLLANHLDLDGKSSMSVGYYELSDPSKKFNQVDTTETWCWQQGCRLRWFDINKKTVIYNKMIDGEYGSTVRDLRTKTVIKEIHAPIYDLSLDRSIGASLNFSRLQRLRPGYGYKNLEDQYLTEQAPKDDGLFLVDIENDESELVVSLDTVSKLDKKESMIGAHHYFNHIFFSPDSKYIMFFHLWDKKEYRDSRLFRYDIDKQELKLIINNTVSHYAWKTDSSFLLTEFMKGVLNYNVYDIDGNFLSVLGENNLNKDGHPSFSKKGDFIISDTYPNHFRFQSLFKHCIKTDKTIILSKFYSPNHTTGEEKCDLHPRLSEDNKKVAIDSTDYGKREIVVLDLN